MRRGAILCASGIGDGLLMMIGAHHLKRAGLTPIVFHDLASDLSSLFPSHALFPHLPFEKLEEELRHYERVVIQNDHSARAYRLFLLRSQKKIPHMTFLFPTPSKMAEKGDIVFEPNRPFASNLSRACQQILGTDFTKENDLARPKGKVHRKHLKRVVLHPTSRDQVRNWRKGQFISLAKKLEKRGFSPVFCVSSNERREWAGIEGICVPKFETLSQVCAYLYESGFFIGNDSGLGHLASNVGLPTVTVSGNPKRVALWRPDWSLNKIATLPFPLPNLKGIGLRIRDNYWQPFVPVSRVLETFMELVDASRCDSL